MRIAILEPYIKGVGGAQKVIADYANYLQERGHYVEIFTRECDPNYTYPHFRNIKITLLKPKSKILVALLFMLRRFKDFDLIIANDWPSNFSSIRNKKVVWICYSPKRDFYDLKEFYMLEAGLKKKILMKLKSLLFKRMDIISAKKMKKIFPISKNVLGRVKKYYDVGGEIFYPGINFDEYKSGKCGNYVLSVARFVKPKRVDRIIEAMKYTKNKSVKLYVVGSGPEERKIRNMCNENKNVMFLGKVNGKNLEELYSNCLAAIYVPKDEDWGLIPLEAAACKKPTIGCNEGGLKETIVNGKTGFLMKDISAEKIAEKIDLLANNKILAKKMGESAYKYCKQFDWKNILPKFESSLNKLIT